MKKITSLLLALSILFTLSVINGCKKGENDPFFSIRSRKARVAGDWTVFNFISNVVTTNSDGDINVTNKFTISGTSCSETYAIRTPSIDTTWTHSGTVNTATYTFEKDGTMEGVLDYTITVVETIDPNAYNGITTITTTTTNIIEPKGTWDFLSGVDEYKNKERLTLIVENEKVNIAENIKTVEKDADEIVVNENLVTNSTNNKYEYANGENSIVWAITQLKDKEMILERTINTITTDNDGYWVKESGSETMTLTQGKDEE